MFVRTMIGRYAGDVIDMLPHVANRLIRLGRAVDIREEAEPERRGPAPVSDAGAKPRKRRKGT